MTAALGTLGNDGINAQRFQMLCQHHRRHHRDDRDARRFPHRHILSGISCPGGNDPHAFLDNDFGKRIRLRVHQHNIYAKGLVSQRTAAADVFPQGVGVHTAGADQPQRPGVGAGSGEFACGNVGHTSLNDGIFCA